MMEIMKRIQLCRLIEKMHKNEIYSGKLGITDISTFRGKRISKEK